MLYCFWKLLQATIGYQSEDTCSWLCKMSALSFPLIDFSVYLFLRIRNEKSVMVGEETKARKVFEKILFGMTFITPVLAILNAVFGSGTLKKQNCTTQPKLQVAITVAVFEVIVNFGFLLLFVLPLRQLARDRSALDSRRVQEISRRNFLSCLLCVVGGVFTNVTAGLLSADAQFASASPYLVFGSIIMVIGVLFSTWKAWEWQAIGLGKVSRVIDENGDARPSEPSPIKSDKERFSGIPDGVRDPSGARTNPPHHSEHDSTGL